METALLNFITAASLLSGSNQSQSETIGSILSTLTICAMLVSIGIAFGRVTSNHAALKEKFDQYREESLKNFNDLREAFDDLRNEHRERTANYRRGSHSD